MPLLNPWVQQLAMPQGAYYVPPVPSSPNQEHVGLGPYSMEATRKRTRSLPAASRYPHAQKRDSSRNQNLPSRARYLHSQLYLLLSRLDVTPEHALPCVAEVSMEKLSVRVHHSHQPGHLYIPLSARMGTPSAVLKR